MSIVNEYVAKALELEPSALETMLSTDEGKAELTTKLQSIKVLNASQEDEYFKTRLSTLDKDAVLSSLSENQRLGITGSIKGSTLEGIEKSLKDQNGFADWVRGKDYRDVSELASKIVQSKVAASSGNDDVKKIQESHLAELQRVSQEGEQRLNETTSSYMNRIKSYEFNSALNTANVTGDGEVLKTRQAAILATFNQLGYKLEPNGDSFSVVDVEGKPAAKNYKPQTLSDIFSEINHNLFGAGTPNVGRGQNAPTKQQQGQGARNYAKYTSMGDLVSELTGEGMQVTDKAFKDIMAELKTARPELK